MVHWILLGVGRPEDDVRVSPPDCWIAFRTDLRDIVTVAGPACLQSVLVADTAAPTRVREAAGSSRWKKRMRGHNC